MRTESYPYHRDTAEVLIGPAAALGEPVKMVSLGVHAVDVTYKREYKTMELDPRDPGWRPWITSEQQVPVRETTQITVQLTREGLDRFVSGFPSRPFQMWRLIIKGQERAITFWRCAVLSWLPSAPRPLPWWKRALRSLLRAPKKETGHAIYPFKFEAFYDPEHPPHPFTIKEV